VKPTHKPPKSFHCAPLTEQLVGCNTQEKKGGVKIMKYVIMKRWIIEAANETEANQYIDTHKPSPVSHQTFPAGEDYKKNLGFKGQVKKLFFG